MDRCDYCDNTKLSPRLIEQMVMNPKALPTPFRGWRNFRVEYGFECGCPEGNIWLPPHVDPDKVQKVLRGEDQD